MLLAEIGEGDVALFILQVFIFVIWLWLLFTVFADLFRDHQSSGWAKAAWVLFVLILPFLGILVYLIVRGGGMAKRAQEAQADAKKQYDSYIQSVAGSGSGASPTDQIAQAKSLLDAGTISQAEFDELKRGGR